MSNRLPSETSNTNGYSLSGFSASTSSSNVTSALSTIGNDPTDSIFQILSACKCLYVSHRKIAIYLQNLQELEKKNLQSKLYYLLSKLFSNGIFIFNSLGGNHLKGTKKINIAELVASSENDDDDKLKTDLKARNNALLLNKISSSQKPKAPLANLTLNMKNETTKPSPSIAQNLKHSSTVELTTTKIMLKDLRLPLVWKWNDHLKAIKNSDNATAKFATFAIIHLGNMIYDTHLISNIDPSTTDISFNETFIL